MTKQEQATIEGVEPADKESAHMIARISAIAVKMVYPFMAQNDIRYYLNAVNVRPLDDGSVMVVATDGHRYVVVRDPNGMAERELIVSVSKDALKHAGNSKHTLDVMSNGSAMISGQFAEQLFVQPGNSLLEANYPRIERVASTLGYKEGISGAVNPRYLADALTIGKNFGGTIRFFSRNGDSPLTFLLGGIGELECFGGIMKIRESFENLPSWFPAATEATSLDEV